MNVQPLVVQTDENRWLAWLREHALQIMAVLIWVGVIGIVYLYMNRNDLTLPQVGRALESFMTDNWFGPLVFFFVVVVLRPFTLVPIMVFVAIGGYVYGVGVGFVLSMVTASAAAIIPYYFGRLFPVDLDKDRPKTGRFSMIAVARDLARFLQRNAFEALVTLRMFGPYDVGSFVAGNLRIPLGQFLAATTVGNIAWIYAFVALGAALEDISEAGDVSVNIELIVSSVVVLVISFAVSRYLRSRVNAG